MESDAPPMDPLEPDPHEPALRTNETPSSNPEDEEAASAPATDATEKVEVAPLLMYSELKLIRPLQEAIEHAKYITCTPVQAAVIPQAMRGTDVIGQAQTGTGKTAAFLIPFLNRWRPHKLHGPIGLVMCPTRELALQVASEAEKLAPSSRFRTVAVYGGAKMGRQLDQLARGCDLVVGTPGRMLDHLRRGSMQLEHVRYVVLDEADRMLDIGFRPDIERILKRCPEQRQTLLMSATVPDSIKKLVHRYMKDPVHLSMSPNTLTVDKIRQTYITVDEEKKFDLLLKVIEREQPRQCLIFVERKRWAERLYRNLHKTIKESSVIHGGLPQGFREKVTALFRVGKIKYLIATDVMSRGIDVCGISHVINYDLPGDIENYVHRIGRTGRIGRDGIAISFVTPEQGGHLTNIEMTINRLIEEDRIEGFDAYQPRTRKDDTVRVLSSNGHTAEEPAAVEEPSEPPASEKKTVFGKTSRKYTNRL